MTKIIKAYLLPGIFILTLNIGAQSVSAQSSTECNELLTRAMAKVKSTRLIATSTAFELVAQITITPEKGPPIRERMEMIALGEKYKYVTNEYRLYQDNKTMVVIQPNEKSIFMTRPLPEKTRQNQFANMIAAQDSLLQELSVRSCSREFGTVVSDAGYTKVVCVASPKLEKMGFKTVSYWIDAQTAEVKKISMDYTPGSIYKLKRYEMVIEKMSTQSVSIPFKGDALSQAMEHGKLRNEFNAFQVVDKRK
jgi:hypothetical protein